MEDQSEALKSISASESQLKSLYDDLHRAKEMLQMDKSFLQKEVSELVTKDHQNQRTNETQATKIIQLEAKVYRLLLLDLIPFPPPAIPVAAGTHGSTHAYPTINANCLRRKDGEGGTAAEVQSLFPLLLTHPDSVTQR